MSISMRQFCNTFHNKMVGRAPWTNRANTWSRFVFSTIGEMAVNKNMCFWASSGRIPNKQLLKQIAYLNDMDKPYEYMVDMCWTKVDRRNWSHKRIEVAIECEWNRNISELEWDFAKLLDINAPRKIFVCDSNPKKQKQTERFLKEMIKSYDPKRLISGDQILLIDIGKEIKYICWEIGKSKQIKEIFSFSRNWQI